LQERDPKTDEYIVREKHRHLWTEVYFEGVGWVAFDATRNAPEIVDGANDALASEEAQQARRQWLQRALDVLIGVIVLAMLYLLVAPRVGWRAGTTTPRAQRLYGQLLFALRLLGLEPPATGQTPRAYLDAAAVRLSQQGSRAADALRTLTPRAHRLPLRPARTNRRAGTPNRPANRPNPTPNCAGTRRPTAYSAVAHFGMAAALWRSKSIAS
jgi:hypothetical protein